MAQIGWIGLGVMGAPMAGHLAKQGHTLAVYNRTASKAQDWVAAHGTGRVAQTPAEAGVDADFVFACVGDDNDVRAVTKGEDGAFSRMKPGSIFIDCTTASAEVARELAAVAAEKDIGFLDAPVSGGQAGAENGALTVMIGGAEATFEQAVPVIDGFARKVTRIGDSGAGQTAKMVNQICIAGLVQGLSEGLNLAARAGLDIPAVMEAISEGAAGSWQMSNRWETMTNGQYEFGFAVDWMRKDLSIAIAEARRVGAPVPVGALVDQFYAEIQRMGGGRWDTSSLMKRLAG